MLGRKRGISIISLSLSIVAMGLVATALIVTTNNVAENRARAVKPVRFVESSAYTKVYTKQEVENIAIKSFVDNYLPYYDGEITLVELEALVLGDLMQRIPKEQLDNYVVRITGDTVEVDNK